MPSFKTSRRAFVGLAGAALAVGTQAAERRETAAKTGSGTSRRPLVIATGNGHVFRNGGPRTCVEEAWERIARGEDVLDALVAGVQIVELDPADDGVGYGGLPNADGIVQLDASVMHGSLRRAGAVAGIEGIRTPSVVARAVANLTDHHLLVGAGAQALARQIGLVVEPDLNTEHSRGIWLEWKRRIDPEHWLDPGRRPEAAAAATASMVRDGLLDRNSVQGTIHCHAVGAHGEVAGVTTTSGLAFKIPGRVGDSPILGAGNWIDGAVGAAGSTGRGEANLYNLSSHLVVELMRGGAHPKDAALEALRRVRANTVDTRLRNAHGEPKFNVKFYVSNVRGDYAGVALYEDPEATFAVCDANGARLEAMAGLLPWSSWEDRAA
jgi:N4-(beta-N-acetylglucosaminyl)-L-asparaginase